MWNKYIIKSEKKHQIAFCIFPKVQISHLMTQESQQTLNANGSDKSSILSSVFIFVSRKLVPWADLLMDAGD